VAAEEKLVLAAVEVQRKFPIAKSIKIVTSLRSLGTYIIKILIYYLLNYIDMNKDTESHEKKKVLFLCTHNSARSQMAEGLLRAMYRNRYEAYSAGVKATNVNPLSIIVMKEIGIDISSQYSKTPQEFQDIIFDVAVTVCDNAKAVCPIVITNLERPNKLTNFV
jgi:arsenate reductase (thioredoxin)